MRSYFARQVWNGKGEKMEIPFWQIDAFSSTVFSGNPAGVCLLEKWLDDKTLQSIAAENNLPETAFMVSRDDHYDLRWFTPELEIDLCGKINKERNIAGANYDYYW